MTDCSESPLSRVSIMATPGSPGCVPAGPRLDPALAVTMRRLDTDTGWGKDSPAHQAMHRSASASVQW